MIMFLKQSIIIEILNMICDVIHVFLQSIVAVLKRIMISCGMCNHKIFAVIFYFAVLKIHVTTQQ